MRGSLVRISLICLMLVPFWGLPTGLAAGEIAISEISLDQKSLSEHWVYGTVTNTTAEPREVTLRAQVVFFDQASPPGDVPATVLRKDTTLILQPREIKKLEIKFIEEGAKPLQPHRAEPQLRVRRQRVWKY